MTDVSLRISVIDVVDDYAAGVQLCGDEFGVNQEEFLGVDGAHRQIIVCIFPAVEMETAEFPFVNEVSDDEFDVGALGVMPQVY